MAAAGEADGSRKEDGNADDWEHSEAGQEAAREGYFKRVNPDKPEDEVTEASQGSFPASDAPSWTPTTGSEKGGKDADKSVDEEGAGKD